MPSPDLEARVKEIVDAFNGRDFERAATHFHGELVVEFPQSGERITGRKNLLGMAAGFSAPTFRIWRMCSAGPLVTAETVADYPDGGRFLGVSIFEFSDGRVAREIDYFTESFPPAESRAKFVTVHDIPAEGG